MDFSNRHIFKFRPLRGEYIIVANIAKALVVFGNRDFLLRNIFLAWHVLSLLVKDEALDVVAVRVITDGPLSLQNEVNFRDISLFVEDVTIFCVGLETARHEAESDLVDEVRIKLLAGSEEITEGGLVVDDIIEEEASHDKLLDPVWNSVKVLLLLEKDLTAILIPIIVEMILDLLSKSGINILNVSV